MLRSASRGILYEILIWRRTASAAQLVETYHELGHLSGMKDIAKAMLRAHPGVGSASTSGSARLITDERCLRRGWSVKSIGGTDPPSRRMVQIRHPGHRSPAVPSTFPDRVLRWRKLRISESADRHGDEVRSLFGDPEDGRAAIGTEAEGDDPAAVCRSDEGRGLAHRLSNPLARKPSLHPEDTAGPPLAIQAMAHRDAGRWAFAYEPQLTAGASGFVGRHGTLAAQELRGPP